jgi:hypothetical protein
VDRPVDHSLIVRKAVVAHLKADAALAALVSPGSIYGEEPPPKPDWPFVRYGFPVVGGYVATGKQGSVLRITLHAFAHGPFTDAIYKIAAAITEAMESFSIPALDLVDRQWLATNVVRDSDDANGYHAICEFTVTPVLSG